MARVPPSTPRVRLARLALDAALALPEVADGSSGPAGSTVTGDRGEVLRGVSASAAGGGRYDLTVRLTVNPTPAPLHALAERLRDSIAQAARRAGLGTPLGRIDVHFADVARGPEAGPAAPAPAPPRPLAADRPGDPAAPLPLTPPLGGRR